MALGPISGKKETSEPIVWRLAPKSAALALAQSQMPWQYGMGRAFGDDWHGFEAERTETGQISALGNFEDHMGLLEGFWELSEDKTGGQGRVMLMEASWGAKSQEQAGILFAQELREGEGAKHPGWIKMLMVCQSGKMPAQLLEAKEAGLLWSKGMIPRRAEAWGPAPCELLESFGAWDMKEGIALAEKELLKGVVQGKRVREAKKKKLRV